MKHLALCQTTKLDRLGIQAIEERSSRLVAIWTAFANSSQASLVYECTDSILWFFWSLSDVAAVKKFVDGKANSGGSAVLLK